MCGILGAIGKFDQASFTKGLRRLSHRGPDGEGVWSNSAGALLGHRRLAIIDLSTTGEQPMVDNNLTIIFNGEIYNYYEIRKQLISKGHVFVSSSDTEVILKAFREWGHHCVEKFNGMWAFAIWDDEKRRLFLSRDRFGVKPLFYSFTSGGFLFGSEMKALSPMMDDVAISKDFKWCEENIYGYETSERTLITNISRFPVGHYSYFNQGEHKLSPVQYWSTLEHLERPEEDYEKQVDRFRELFFDACRIRMRSDVKIGTALSGGLDSSSVAAAMQHIGNRDFNDIQPDWQNAFVATFKGTELDEREYADAVVKKLNLKGNFYEIDPAKGIDNLDEYLWLFEELSLTSPIPMIEIYKKIKENGVAVSIDGHGADELLSGYGTSLFNAVKDNPFNISEIKRITSIYKQMRGVEKGELETFIDGFAGRKNLLKFYLRYLLRIKDSDPLINQLGYFNAALYHEFHHYILPTLLRNYDRYSMAAGVEVRMPFMDYRLVSYTFSLPWRSKLKGEYTKSILRDAIAPYLPEKVVRRKIKTGFGTPFTDWFKGPWKNYLNDLINSTSFKQSALIDQKKSQTLVEQFYKNPNPDFAAGHEIWAAIMPYLWERAFFSQLNK